MILPTHTCFDDALRYVVTFGGEDRSDIRIIHALCRGDGDREYLHAWVEQKNELGERVAVNGAVVQDEFMYIFVPVLEYRERMRIVIKHQYDFVEAVIESLKNDSSGPWNADLRIHERQNEDVRAAYVGSHVYSKMAAHSEPPEVIGLELEVLYRRDPEVLLIFSALTLPLERRQTILDRLRHEYYVVPEQ